MPGRPGDVGAMLISQLETLAGPDIRILLKKEKPWASITFSGTRHYLIIDATGNGGVQSMNRFIKRLPDQVFDLPDHFIADLLIRDPAPGDQEVMLEILTIIDPVARPES